MLDGSRIVIAVVDCCIGRAVTLSERWVVDCRLFVGLLDLVGGFCARPLWVRRRWIRRTRVHSGRGFSTTTPSSSRQGRGQRGRSTQRHQNWCQRRKLGREFDHSSLLLAYMGDPSTARVNPASLETFHERFLFQQISFCLSKSRRIADNTECPPALDFREPGRSPCSDRRSNCDCNRRVASRFLADSPLRLAHSTAHKKTVGGVSCHSLKQIPCGTS